MVRELPSAAVMKLGYSLRNSPSSPGRVVVTPLRGQLFRKKRKKTLLLDRGSSGTLSLKILLKKTQDDPTEEQAVFQAGVIPEAASRTEGPRPSPACPGLRLLSPACPIVGSRRRLYCCFLTWQPCPSCPCWGLVIPGKPL